MRNTDDETAPTVVLTAEMIHAAKNGQGGWNRRQVAALGVPWPLAAGWVKDLVGREVPREVPREAYRMFVSLRHEPGTAARRKAVLKRKHQAERAIAGLIELDARDALGELARLIGRGIAGPHGECDACGFRNNPDGSCTRPGCCNSD